MIVIPEEKKLKAIDMVRNGTNYLVTSKKLGISYETVRGWCLNEDVKTQFKRIKKSDTEIIAAIKEAKVVTQAELSHALDYRNITVRLRKMLMADKVKSTMIPARSSAAKMRWPIAGYQNKRLYYIDDDDLVNWLLEKLPPHMPLGMRRAVTMKLTSIGVSLPELTPRKKYNPVALEDDIYIELKTMAKERKMSLRLLVESLIRKGLETETNNKTKTLK